MFSSEAEVKGRKNQDSLFLTASDHEGNNPIRECICSTVGKHKCLFKEIGMSSSPFNI
jgi:hypothetical protein